MTPEMQQSIDLALRLERIDVTLRRICFELDLAINGIRHLLGAQGHRAIADSIAEQLEQAHDERVEAESDTLPPDAQ